MMANKESMYITFNIETLYNKIKDQSINLHPKYQRGYIWSNTKKVGLIQSIVNGYPIPGVMFSQTDVVNVFNVMDGKQRLSAIEAFKDDKICIKVEGIEYTYSELTERQKAKFDATTISVSVSFGLTEEDESFIYERINRAVPLSGGEMIMSYLYSPFTKTRDELFSMKNPLFEELCTYIGRVVGATISERLLKVFKPIKLSSEVVAPTTLYIGSDDKGHHKRNNKIADWSGYVGGLAVGPEYITTSFTKLQPLLEMDSESWNQYVPMFNKKFESFVKVWRAAFNEMGVILPKKWANGSRIWRMGFLNAYIIYSLWVDDEETVISHWKDFIMLASLDTKLMDKWKDTTRTYTLNLTQKRIHNGWEQVKTYIRTGHFKSISTIRQKRTFDEV